jgi:hypothetical protein
MSKGGSSKPQTTTTTTEPPKYLAPFLQQGMQGAQSLYNQGPAQYYPGQTVVGFSPETESALGMQSSRAQSGSPVLAGANQFATNTLNGGQPQTFGGGTNPYGGSSYQDPASQFGGGGNPYLDATFDQAARATQTGLASQFAGSGRNISASRPARAEELQNLATGIYGGAYENDRSRQLQAEQASAGRGLSAYLQGQQIGASGYESERDRMASEMGQNRAQQLGVLGMAPELAASDYGDIDRLAAVGQQREDLTGRQMQDEAARWDFGQNAQGSALDQYLGRLNGYPGMSGSSSTPIYRNQAAGALGGAGMGYQIGNQFGGNGGLWGAAAGGLLGYLGG